MASAAKGQGKRLPLKEERSGFKGWVKDIVEEANEILHDKSQKMDMTLFWIIIALVGIGTVLMYSASYAYAFYNRDGNSHYFLERQALFAVVGLGLMFLVSLIPAYKLKSITLTVLIISTILLIIVLFLPEKQYVHRWIDLGFTDFQPSELTKFAIILFGATWADSHKDKMHTFKWGVLPFAVVVGISGVLLLLEPHISCTVLILLIAATMMWVGGVKVRWFICLGCVVAAALIFIIFSGSIGYSSSRIEVWKDPFVDPTGKGWQNIQALYAISLGGLLGQGLGNSRQKYLYIAEPQNDFVFAVICEELGFVGAVAIIALFVLFIWRGFTISINNTNRFSRLLGIGITAQIGWQAFLNMAVVTKVAPNTGISLPFFSYGGSSLIMLLLEMGVLLSISRHSTIKKI